MDTYIVYFDETGDDGVTTKSSDQFILTSIYMPATSWQANFDKIKVLRKRLKEEYGFYTTEEMHTKNFLTEKEPYRKYNWTPCERLEILKAFTLAITELDLKIINVIIDKTKFVDDNYKVLENALKYSIQRIENDSNGEWNYTIITDRGRVTPMRKTAREIRAFNPIQSKYTCDYKNQPIKNLIEDILEKDSSESYFIQICDFVSYFVHLYYKCYIKKECLPNRVGKLIDKEFVGRMMATLKAKDSLNLKANLKNAYGLVIYPK